MNLIHAYMFRNAKRSDGQRESQSVSTELMTVRVTMLSYSLRLYSESLLYYCFAY